MKKNKMMRLASALLVAVLLTTCAISGTFAKYTTSANVSDEAIIAKWGVKLTPTVEGSQTAFYETYKNADGDVTVSAANKTFAPGTSGNLAGFDISGTPEVAVKVTFEGTFYLTGFTIKDQNGADMFYCPLIFKVGTTTINGREYINKQSELEDAVNGAINFEKEYDPNTNLATETIIDMSWEWPFEIEGTADEKDLANKYDTALGDTTSTVDITLKTTVEQID